MISLSIDQRTDPGIPCSQTTRPGVSSPEAIATILRDTGLDVTLLSADELADPTRLNASRFDLVVIPAGDTFPAKARRTLIENLTLPDIRNLNANGLAVPLKSRLGCLPTSECMMSMRHKKNRVEFVEPAIRELLHDTLIAKLLLASGVNRHACEKSQGAAGRSGGCRRSALVCLFVAVGRLPPVLRNLAGVLASLPKQLHDLRASTKSPLPAAPPQRGAIVSVQPVVPHGKSCSRT